MKVPETYLREFERFEQRPQQPSWLLPLRKAGMASFGEEGFPTLKHEDWRFTNLAPVIRLPFKPVLTQASEDFAFEMVDQKAFAKLPGGRLVFVDGHFSAKLSDPGPLPAGTVISNLVTAMSENSALVEKHLGRYAQPQGNAFSALNQAFFIDGAFIHLPEGTVLEAPIRLLFVASGRRSGVTVHARNLILAGANSKATILEHYTGDGNTAYVTNAVTELVAVDNANVELLKVQDEAEDAIHIATIQGQFGRSSQVAIHSFALGARLSRNNIRAKLAGEGLECVLNGLYVTRKDQLADHHMIVEHAEPHCASHEYFNGILDDKSKGVFHGRIYVHRVAQKTDAKQTNKNLLLSDEATVDTKPQLEIYADDVKCTHGATVGQLNDEAIFYLRSRGISTETARQMLIHAFAGEIIDRIRCEPAREELDRIVWDRLEANPHLAEKA